MKNRSNYGWIFVAPAVVLLGIVGLIPLLTVINYSFFEIFILDQRFWVGLNWYGDIIRSDRFWSSFGCSALFSALVLVIQIPLGIAIALCIPREISGWRGLCHCRTAVVGAMEYDPATVARSPANYNC